MCREATAGSLQPWRQRVALACSRDALLYLWCAGRWPHTQQRALDGVKLKLAAFYVKNPINPRDEDEPRADAEAIVYLDDDELLLQTLDPDALSDYLLYRF